MWMSSKEIALIESYLDMNFCAIEYGAGSSTSWFSSKVKKVGSIEHNRIWFDSVAATNMTNSNVAIIYVKPEYDWGEHCMRDGNEEEFRSYIKSPSQFGFVPDFVLIDGRARIECCKFVAENYKNVIIAFHDYYGRHNDVIHNYSRVLDYVTIVDSVDTLAIMKSIV